MKSKYLYSTKCLNPNYLRVAILFLLLGFMHTLKAQTPIYGEMLEPNEANCSSFFKSQIGQIRDTTYNHLEKLIMPIPAESMSSEILSNAIGAKVTTMAEVIYMLGEPDNKIENKIFEYCLKPSPSNCKAVIGFNASEEVTFKVIKNCP